MFYYTGQAVNFLLSAMQYSETREFLETIHKPDSIGFPQADPEFQTTSNLELMKYHKTILDGLSINRVREVWALGKQGW
jgi:hypothetical protein